MNYSNLSTHEIIQVEKALLKDGYFYGYIPEKGREFILNNFSILSDKGCLEKNWIDAYLFSSTLHDVPYDLLKEVFNKCDRQKLQELYPVPSFGAFGCENRFTLFRGCVGTDHRMGMSWTSSLDKAIWYAAHHSIYYDVGNCCVYAATIDKSEIYCFLDHNEPEFIVVPKVCWEISIPQSEFTLSRKR